MGQERAQAITLEWFGQLDEDGLALPAKRESWWKKSDDFDAHLRVSYGDDVLAAIRGDLDAWLDDPHDTLALILLLDQITRNIYRGSAEMYYGDARALKAVDRLVASGGDQVLTPQYRVFAYMPLMHAEDRRRQTQSLTLFKNLAESTAGAVQEALRASYDYAQRHAEIVTRFGRFPHRNAILERTSTAEELEFLLEPGSGF